MIRTISFVLSLTIAGSFLACACVAAPDDKPYAPEIAPASNEPQMALRKIRLPDGANATVFAAEPMLANPVNFCIDEKNRFYICETFRLHRGVEDTRKHMYWLDDDLAAQTVEDRVAFFKKHLGEKVKEFAVHHERVRLVEDTDGDGNADKSTVFADGFNQIPDGIGAGLLARRGTVWYTCIPHLWQLKDTKGNGKADFRKALSSGYGVHVAFYGHDLHGLKFGPDGKLYFSIGDRGSNVQTTEGRRLAYPHMGCVFRCNPDGSELEVFASGLRNPQELAFDQYGNLFTGDNNSDGGDQARWVYVVEGGDSGWRIGYQYIESPVARGPWNAEKLWHPQWEGQAAYIVPPIINVCDGPAGLVYYPGTGLSDRYQDHFFLCDFRGNADMSGIHSFAVKPKGASFEFVDHHRYLWNVLPTDVDFGMDGAMYILDWVDGWGHTGKGRIFKVASKELAADKQAESVKKLFAEGFENRSPNELARLLEHADIRVRQEAQFTLADLGKAAIPEFGRILSQSKNRLARLHAIWGLGQLGRSDKSAFPLVQAELSDADPEVRAQAAKVVGECRVEAARKTLERLTRDPEPRVRYFATLAIGKLGGLESLAAVIAMLRENKDRDVYLRHAGIMAFAWIKNTDILGQMYLDPSPSMRLAAVVALRKLESPRVNSFLHDKDPRVVLEAARAIHDVPIGEDNAFSGLASLIHNPTDSEPLMYRVLNAHFRSGTARDALAVARYATRGRAPTSLRIEAIRELGEWSKPSGRDRVTGLWRPLQPRDEKIAADAIRAELPGLFAGPDEVKTETAKVAAGLGIKEIASRVKDEFAKRSNEPAFRIEMLRTLESLKDAELENAMRAGLKDNDAGLRSEARRILAKIAPAEALAQLEGVLESGTPIERQGAMQSLGTWKGDGSDTIIERWLDRLSEKKAPPAMQLEILEAAGQRSSPSIKKKLADFEASRGKAPAVDRYRESLEGGNAERGRTVFLSKAQVSCLRCHKVSGNGGEVGPDLAGIGSRQKREYLLESIVEPNKEIAKGFETVVLGTSTGQFHIGIVKSEDDKEVKLMTQDGAIVTVPKSQIEDRQRGKSAMPEDTLKFLSKGEIRDLVEFLSSLK